MARVVRSVIFALNGFGGHIQGLGVYIGEDGHGVFA